MTINSPSALKCTSNSIDPPVGQLLLKTNKGILRFITFGTSMTYFLALVDFFTKVAKIKKHKPESIRAFHIYGYLSFLVTMSKSVRILIFLETFRSLSRIGISNSRSANTADTSSTFLPVGKSNPMKT
jgi:hypothetical protein